MKYNSNGKIKKEPKAPILDMEELQPSTQKKISRPVIKRRSTMVVAPSSNDIIVSKPIISGGKHKLTSSYVERESNSPPQL